MSRKRDTNWNRDEITVLLDSILEITRMRAQDGKRINSREVFEYAARKLGEKGHTFRAEREKCRTKWKKMKEEFTHAKKARDGDTRYREAPGIQPFYDRMEKFVTGNFDNISPHSTIVRRSSSISSSNNTTSNNTTTSSTSSNVSSKNSQVSRSSARLAASNTTAAQIGPCDVPNVLTDEANHLTCSNTVTITNPVVAIEHHRDLKQQPVQPAILPSNRTPQQPSSRTSSASDGNIIDNHNNNLFPSSTVTNGATPDGINQNASNLANTNILNQNNNHPHLMQQRQPNNYSHFQNKQRSIHTNPSPQHQAITSGEIRSNACNQINSQSIHQNQHNVNNMPPDNSGHHSNHDNDSPTSHNQTASFPAQHADISYRVSTGCRQITIFGDHDVDIKFRGDCVTINKISTDYCSSAIGAATGFKALGNNNLTPNTTRDIDEGVGLH